MKVFFNQLYDYNFYCNKKLIEACSSLERVPERTLALFGHILNSHHIWNHRIMGLEPEYTVWQVHGSTYWPDIHYDNQRESFGIISNTDHFEKRIDYENSTGSAYSNSVQDILFHIINHSTHHRGQILTDFRANGLEVPGPLDYIFYKR